jgi:hypothetical protein
MKRANEFGVLAYYPAFTCHSMEDRLRAHWDGWYNRRQDAEDVMRFFVEKYPDCFVHLVTRVASNNPPSHPHAFGEYSIEPTAIGSTGTDERATQGM